METQLRVGRQPVAPTGGEQYLVQTIYDGRETIAVVEQAVAVHDSPVVDWFTAAIPVAVQPDNA